MIKLQPLQDGAAAVCYNRANGIMWLSFSAIMWASTILGLMHMRAGGILLMAGSAIGVPILPIVYGRIYRKYRK